MLPPRPLPMPQAVLAIAKSIDRYDRRFLKRRDQRPRLLMSLRMISVRTIIDSFKLTERDDGGISRHGVSLLKGGSGRHDTRLDTPPSSPRFLHSSNPSGTAPHAQTLRSPRGSVPRG